MPELAGRWPEPWKQARSPDPLPRRQAGTVVAAASAAANVRAAIGGPDAMVSSLHPSISNRQAVHHTRTRLGADLVHGSIPGQPT